MKSYDIRPDYQPRKTAETFVEDPSEYWNSMRIKTASIYQYHVYKKTANLLSTMSGRSFLDIGCGYPQKVKDLILPITDDVTLVDQPSMKKILVNDFPDMRFIPMNLECGDANLLEKYNCVLCADVVEHLIDPDPLLTTIKNAILPGGIAVFSTPERDIERGENCLSSPKPEHVREWNQAEFAAYLLDSGFKIVEHVLVPKGRLPWYKELIRSWWIRRKAPQYFGCQLVVCQTR